MILDLPKLSRRYQPIDTHDRRDWYLCTAFRNRFISWLFLTFPHLFYQILYTKITRNHFCGLFLKNHKYFREMFLRRLIDVTEKTSFLRYSRGALKTSQKRYLFWDIFETSWRLHKKDIFFEMHLRRLKDVRKKSSFLRCFLDVSEMSLSVETWLRSIRDISCRLGWECLLATLWRNKFWN